MIDFPLTFPVESVQLLYDAWRNKDFRTPGLAKAIWNITGYVLSMGGGLTRRSAGPPPTDDKIDEAFQNLLKGAIDTNAVQIVHSIAEEARDA